MLFKALNYYPYLIPCCRGTDPSLCMQAAAATASCFPRYEVVVLKNEPRNLLQTLVHRRTVYSVTCIPIMGSCVIVPVSVTVIVCGMCYRENDNRYLA